MARFRKKPVVIEAWPVSDLLALDKGHGPAFMPPAIQDAYEDHKIRWQGDHLDIWTLEGVMRANADDVLIRGVQGEFYPCKPDIFADTYEPV